MILLLSNLLVEQFMQFGEHLCRCDGGEAMTSIMLLEAIRVGVDDIAFQVQILICYLFKEPNPLH